MQKIVNGLEITLINEHSYTVGSADNVRTYQVELCRSQKYRYSSAHGLIVGNLDDPDASVICLGVGGVTRVHQYSLAINNDACYVASGDAVFALTLPTLKLRWIKKVDFATCFGVFWVKKFNSLITWGETDICRLHSHGESIWTLSGQHIFTEVLTLSGDNILATDFDGIVHKISIEKGTPV